jgi:hypothetical protein
MLLDKFEREGYRPDPLKSLVSADDARNVSILVGSPQIWRNLKRSYSRSRAASMMIKSTRSVRCSKSKSRLAAENAALRHQLIVLQRRVSGRVQLTNGDRLFLVMLFRWCPIAFVLAARGADNAAAVCTENLIRFD